MSDEKAKPIVYENLAKADNVRATISNLFITTYDVKDGNKPDSHLALSNELETIKSMSLEDICSYIVTAANKITNAENLLNFRIKQSEIGAAEAAAIRYDTDNQKLLLSGVIEALSAIEHPLGSSKFIIDTNNPKETVAKFKKLAHIESTKGATLAGDVKESIKITNLIDKNNIPSHVLREELTKGETTFKIVTETDEKSKTNPQETIKKITVEEFPIEPALAYRRASDINLVFTALESYISETKVKRNKAAETSSDSDMLRAFSEAISTAKDDITFTINDEDLVKQAIDFSTAGFNLKKHKLADESSSVIKKEFSKLAVAASKFQVLSEELIERIQRLANIKHIEAGTLATIEGINSNTLEREINEKGLTYSDLKDQKITIEDKLSKLQYSAPDIKEQTEALNKDLKIVNIKLLIRESTDLSRTYRSAYECFSNPANKHTIALQRQNHESTEFSQALKTNEFELKKVIVYRIVRGDKEVTLMAHLNSQERQLIANQESEFKGEIPIYPLKGTFRSLVAKHHLKIEEVRMPDINKWKPMWFKPDVKFKESFKFWLHCQIAGTKDQVADKNGQEFQAATSDYQRQLDRLTGDKDQFNQVLVKNVDALKSDLISGRYSLGLFFPLYNAWKASKPIQRFTSAFTNPRKITANAALGLAGGVGGFLLGGPIGSAAGVVGGAILVPTVVSTSVFGAAYFTTLKQNKPEKDDGKVVKGNKLKIFAGLAALATVGTVAYVGLPAAGLATASGATILGTIAGAIGISSIISDLISKENHKLRGVSTGVITTGALLIPGIGWTAPLIGMAAARTPMFIAKNPIKSVALFFGSLVGFSMLPNKIQNSLGSTIPEVVRTVKEKVEDLIADGVHDAHRAGQEGGNRKDKKNVSKTPEKPKLPTAQELRQALGEQNTQPLDKPRVKPLETDPQQPIQRRFVEPLDETMEQAAPKRKYVVPLEESRNNHKSYREKINMENKPRLVSKTPTESHVAHVEASKTVNNSKSIA